MLNCLWTIYTCFTPNSLVNIPDISWIVNKKFMYTWLTWNEDKFCFLGQGADRVVTFLKEKWNRKSLWKRNYPDLSNYNSTKYILEDFLGVCFTSEWKVLKVWKIITNVRTEIRVGATYCYLCVYVYVCIGGCARMKGAFN